MYLSFLPAVADEVEHPGELFVGQLQVGFFGGPSDGEDGEQTPPFYSHFRQEFLEEFQVFEILLVYASHYIPDNLFLFRQHTDGVDCILETFRMTAQPVMCFFEAVEADGCRMHAGGQQRVQPFACHQQSVGNDSPGISPAVKFHSAGFDVFAHQSLSSGKNYQYFIRIDMGSNIVYNFQKIFHRHILHASRYMAVAAAMTAGCIATKRTFPKECA